MKSIKIVILIGVSSIMFSSCGCYETIYIGGDPVHRMNKQEYESRTSELYESEEEVINDFYYNERY